MGTRQATRSVARPARTVTTGIIRHLDELGRIVIPIEIRKRFGRKAITRAVLVGRDEGLIVPLLPD